MPGLAVPGERGDAAEAFLRAALAAGPRRVRELLEEADHQGVKRRLLRDAKDALGLVVSKERGVQHGGWTWGLPAAPPERDGADTAGGGEVKVTLPHDAWHVTLTSSTPPAPDDGRSGQDDTHVILGERHLDLAAEPAPRCWQCDAALVTPEELACATCARCRPAR